MRSQRCVVVLALLLLGLVGVGQASATAPSQLRIEVLSNRADLISGGDALVRVEVPRRTDSRTVRVGVNGRDVTAAFRAQPDGGLVGLVDGLTVGSNVVTARERSSAGVRITITNHPIGGPVFSGTQLQPWICATVAPRPVTVAGNAGQTATATTRASGLSREPVDAQCNTPADYFFYYQPKAKQGSACTFTITGPDPCLVPFPVISDPTSRPADAGIADFTNDRGATAKSIVRVERGVLNRNIYQLATFYDPASFQHGWNQKLFWRFGPGASASRFMESPAVGTLFDDRALRKGFMVASSHLTNNGSNSNNTLAAETAMMVKERIAENYGQIRYTLSDGASGGSVMQNTIASAYPGLTNGAMVIASYPDLISTWVEVADCGLLSAQPSQVSPGGYFFRAGSPGASLTVAQKTAINGHAMTPNPTVPGFCDAWTASLISAANPASAGNCGNGFPPALVYSATNPQGIRCDTYDHDASLVGTFVDTDGVRKANVPRDNVGLQYGLEALQAGTITAEQFVQLNEGVGGYNADRVWTPGRMSADPDVLRDYHSGGLVSDGRQLAKTPIIDMRPDNPANGDIHMNWRSMSLRDRLDRDHGDHDSQVTWSGNQAGLAAEAFTTMDTWLTNIENDRTPRSLETKVARDKPAAATDFCQLADGSRVGLLDAACPVKYFGSPRQAAGGPVAENVLKCRLKPVDFRGFTSQQQTRLRAVFPNGVCDWNRPGVGQVPVNPWTTFADGPGGKPLGDPPVSRRG